jgi:UrcA family protein
MISFNRTGALRSRLSAALAIGAFAFMSAGAQAAAPDEITISAPSVKTVGRDAATGAPIQDITRKISLKFAPVTLTTNSGVALIKDSLYETARKVCESIDPTMLDDDDTCIRDTVNSVQPQLDAAIARARSASNG